MATSRVTDDGDTATRILDSAESLVQVRGFNGFSYADVAAELAVTKASLHYHFPGKAELGRALIVRYATRFNAALAGIDASGADAPAMLGAYARLYADVLRGQRMCLCGMLAAEYQTLARADARGRARLLRRERGVGRARARSRAATRERWCLPATPREAARLIVSALEGAMLVARPYGDVERFEAAADRLLAGFRETP